MRLAVLKERRVPEARVAATPDTVKRLLGLGLTVAVETGAGAQASIHDALAVAFLQWIGIPDPDRRLVRRVDMTKYPPGTHKLRYECDVHPEV